MLATKSHKGGSCLRLLPDLYQDFLDAQLMAQLRRLADPRVTAADAVFDYPSYSDPGFGRPPGYSP